MPRLKVQPYFVAPCALLADTLKPDINPSMFAAAQVTNAAELAAAMTDVGANLGLKVRPYTATPRAPLASYVAAMARTGVLVARHGPLLANAAFLPPGAHWLRVDGSGF